jgi:putative phosphoribosyl transferase
MFATREDAGRRLGCHLKERAVQADLVLGLPRGGVIVAAEVARILRLPLDVLVVRKLGHPRHREFAVGALAEGGVVVLDEETVGDNALLRAELRLVIQEESRRLGACQASFHGVPSFECRGKTVLLVDDGLATGATTEAAVRSARNQFARRIIVAAPVASTHAVTRLQLAADEVVTLLIDPDFDAVGRYYDKFPQTTDEEVIGLLGLTRKAFLQPAAGSHDKGAGKSAGVPQADPRSTRNRE